MFRILLIMMIACTVQSAKFPTDLEKCKYDDEKCYINVANTIMKRGSKGYAELGLPVFEPLFVNKIGIDQGGDGPVVLKLHMKDVNIHGFSGVKFKAIKGLGKNIDKAKIDLKYTQPIFQMIGKYTTEGKVLVLPVQGDGNCNITLVNNDCHVKLLTKKIEKNGKSYMQIDKIKFNFDTTDAKIVFENLFNGNKELSDTFNLFINDNWRDILKEIKPAMSESIAAVYKQIINNIFGNIPYDELFTE
ncbi:hypothetical protein PVAND_005902 [Polypedilum vanderplanki]|uniref:Uncharacterized protein n=1 Tax=Polypedilum vanderplanki TaxID=319348 RepID=A0A9J6C2E3_POLVA|nr:hypothetical protein PVAND_005902 [Polypedilum vanderplanki]